MAYALNMAQWQGQRLTDLFVAASAPYSDEQKRRSYMRSVQKQLDDITDLLNPFADEKPKKHTGKSLLTDAEKMELLKRVNAIHAGTPDEIVKSVIQEAHKLKKAE